MKCALTGHRELKGFNEKVMEKEIDHLIKKGVDTFYCGMAVGFDLTVCKYLVGKAKVIACVPYPEQDEKFSDDEKKLYHDLLKKCDDVVTLSLTYHKDCFRKRNYYMVDEADMVYTFFNGNKRSGTSMTVNYANKQGKQVFYHEPERTI